MRRTLEVISLGLFLVGLELATGTPSLTITRLQETLAYPLGSDGGEGVEWGVLAGIGLILMAVVLAGMTVLVRYRQEEIQDHLWCPKCGVRTKRVRRRTRHRVLGRIVGRAISARHCPGCGWRGLSYFN